MLYWVIKYLGFLKHIPLLPLVFDVWLRLWTLIFHKEVHLAMEKLEEELQSWPGVKISLHKFGGIQFNYKGKELGHMHGNGLIDVLLNKKTKQQLVLAGIAQEHHILKKSGWVSFSVCNKTDTEVALSILKKAYMAKMIKNI